MASESKALDRTTLNFIVDALAFAVFAFMTATGLLMRYVLQPGVCSKRYRVWGYLRHGWGDIHFWLAVAFFSLMAVHLFLHWRWIVAVVTGKPREGSGFRVGMGLFGLLMVIALSVLPFFSKPISDKAIGYSAKQLATVPLDGSMTLTEVSNKFGIAPDYLMMELDIPESASPGRTIFDLSAEYGFKVSDVKEVILEYNEPEEHE